MENCSVQCAVLWTEMFRFKLRCLFAVQCSFVHSVIVARCRTFKTLTLLDIIVRDELSVVVSLFSNLFRRYS